MYKQKRIKRGEFHLAVVIYLLYIDQNMFLLGENAAILLNEKIDNKNKYSKNVPDTHSYTSVIKCQ